MINKYPYMFLWKPVLVSFITTIDKLAHIKYLEYGKVLDSETENAIPTNVTLRKAMKSDKNKNLFGELIKK